MLLHGCPPFQCECDQVCAVQPPVAESLGGMASAGYCSDLDHGGSIIYQHTAMNSFLLREPTGCVPSSTVRYCSWASAQCQLTSLYSIDVPGPEILNILVGCPWFNACAWARHWQPFQLCIIYRSFIHQTW